MSGCTIRRETVAPLTSDNDEKFNTRLIVCFNTLENLLVFALT